MNDCDLCQRRTVRPGGKDRLLYEDDFCYIADNGNTHLKRDGRLQFAQRRITLFLNRHGEVLTEEEETQVRDTLTKFMASQLGMRESDDYFIQCTMGTYPQHYHTHAYVPPFTDEGEIRL